MSPGLEAAVGRWSVADRQAEGAGRARVTFSRDDGRAFVVAYDLGARRAALEAEGGRVAALTAPEEASRAADAAAWQCDCPAGAAGLGVCLHAALAARGIAEGEAADEEEGFTLSADAPDGRYAAALEVSPGLAAAAVRAEAAVERVEGGLRITVGGRAPGALVTLVDGGIGCDCPMAPAPACLHRVIAAGWARGDRQAEAPAAAARSAAAAAPTVLAAAPAARGEKLPAEDVERFQPVLDRVDALVAELISFGLQRVTAATLERIETLAIAARALGVRDAAPRHAGLGRIARTLDRVRQLVGEFQERLVTTTELDVLRELAVLRNLARAVRANTGALPLSDFAGATQQEYVDAGVVDAQGLGFEAWTTPAGFAGVTVYVADLRTGRVLTRTNALPAETAADFAARGWGSVPWADQLASQAAFAGSPVSLLDLGRGRYLLTGAQIAPDSGRLSGSGKTQLAKRQPVGLDDAKLRPSVLSGAADAARIAGRLGFDALGRAPSSPPVALIPVRAVYPAQFDRMTQRMVVVVETARGARALCALTYRDDRALWVDNLERLGKAPVAPKALFCRLRLEDGALMLEPLTAYYEKGAPRHLTYKPLEVTA